MGLLYCKALDLSILRRKTSHAFVVRRSSELSSLDIERNVGSMQSESRRATLLGKRRIEEREEQTEESCLASNRLT